MAQLKDLLVYGKSRFIDKIYASDQFISKVAQGTSPFLVDSSTWVENLNVDLLDGYHAEDLMAGGRNYIIDLRANPQTFNPDYLKDIVFISESDYSYLISNGTITKNGITHSYSSSNWYITDKIPEIAEHAYSADYASSAAAADTVKINNDTGGFKYITRASSMGAPGNLYANFGLAYNSQTMALVISNVSSYSALANYNVHPAGDAVIYFNDACTYISGNSGNDLNFHSESGDYYFYRDDDDSGGTIHGNIEWDNILNKPASATGAYGYIGKTPVQDTSVQENLIGIGDSSFNGVMNIKGKQGNYTQGIRIYDAGASSPHNISSLWFRAKRDSEYDAGMIGLTADDTGLRFRLPVFTTGTTPNDYMNILYGGNVGIGATSPSEKLQVAGTIYSSVAHGTQPFKVDSSTLVPKLNVDLLDNEHASQIRANPYTGIHEIYSTDPYFLDSSLIDSTTTFFGYQANTSIVDSPVPGCPTNKAILYTTYKAINTEYFKVIPGSRVGVECWVMRETGISGTDRQFSFQVKTYTSTGTVCTSTNVVWRINITGDSIWKKYSYSQVVPDNATQLNVYFEFNYNNSGKATYFGGLHIYYQDITAYYLLDDTWGDSSTKRLPTPIVYKHGRTYASNATAGWKKIATWTTETLTTERKSKISFFVSGSPKYTGLSKADGILTLSVCWAANSTAASTPSVMSAIWDLATTDLADSPNIDPDDFVLTWKINTTGEEGSEVYTATMNLYCYRPKDYSSYSFQVIDETSGNGYPADFWTLYNNTGANTTIPAEETQVVSKIGAIQAPIIYKHGRGYSANVVNFFWKKVADWTTGSLASERACKISFYVSGGYAWGRINGILTANVRWASGSTAASSPAQAELSWDFVNSTIGNHDVPINLDRFVLTWKVNTGGTEESPVYTATMKIYFYLDRGYTSFSFTKLEEHSGYGVPVDNWKLYSVSGGTAANSSTNLPEDETKVYSKASLIQNPTLGDYAKDKGIIQLYSTDPLFDAELPASYFNANAIVDTSIAGSPISKVLRYTSNTSFRSPYIYIQRGRDIRFDMWVMRLTTASGTAGKCRLRIYRYDKNKNKIDANSYFDALVVVPPKTSVWEKYTYVWHVNESGAEYPTPDPDADPPVESTYKGDGVEWMRIQVLMNNDGTGGIETFFGGVHAYYDDINHLEARRGINEIYSTDYEFLNYNVGQSYLPTGTAGGNITGTVVMTPVGGSPVPKVVLFGTTQRTNIQSFTPLIPVQPGKTILVEVWLMRLTGAGSTSKNWNFQLYQFGKNRENIAATTYITMNMTPSHGGLPSTNLSPMKNSQWVRYTYLYTVPTSGTPYETSGYEGDGVHWIRFHMTANANAASGNAPTYFGGLHVSYTSDTLDGLHASEIRALPNTGLLDIFSTDPIFNDPALADSSIWNATIVDNPVSLADYPGVSGKVALFKSYVGDVTVISDYIPVTPGKTMKVEAWLMRLSGASGTNRVFYIGIQRFDKSKNPIGGSNGRMYFTGMGPCTDSLINKNSRWIKYESTYTIPTTSDEYPTPNPDADPPVESVYKGDGVYYIKFIIWPNYNNASCSPIYLGGIHAYYTDILQQDPVFKQTLVSYAPTYSASTSWTYPGGSYASVANPNIRLLGDSSYGLSTIEFISTRGDTSINRPTDCAFIQYQPYGTTTQSAIGTQPTLAGTGEVNRLVIGVNNDTNDRLILQTPNGDGLRHAVATNNYMIWDEGNDGSGSGLDADLLDGQHGSYYAVATHNHDSSYLKPSQVTGVASLEIGLTEKTYLTVGSTEYKIKLPATIPWTVSTSDEKVKQSADSAANYRGILLGYNSNASANTGIETEVTNVSYVTNKLTVQPSTGNIVTKGWVGVGTGGVNSYIGSDAANNIYLHNSSGYALVASGNVVRRGTSFATAQLGDSANPWANLYTVKEVIQQSGNAALGIATSSPWKIGLATKDLHIKVNNGSGSGVNDGYAGGITFGTDTSTFAGIYYQSSGAYGSRLIFGTTNSYANGSYGRVIISHEGKVGIGTMTPSEQLHVTGTVYSSVAQGTAPLKVDSSTVVSNLNVDYLDGKHASDFVEKIKGAGGAVFYHQNFNTWNGIMITTPFRWSPNVASMFAFTVRLYESYNYTDIVISGYCYNTSKWYSAKAEIIGGNRYYEVKTGWSDTADADGHKHLYFWIGRGVDSDNNPVKFGYGGLSIFNVHAGHDPVDVYSEWKAEQKAASELVNVQNTIIPVHAPVNSTYKLKTIQSTTNSAYPVTFASANNTSLNDVSIYTSGNLTFNPSTNSLSITSSSGQQKEIVVSRTGGSSISLMVGTANANHGLYSITGGKWMVSADASGNVTLNGNANTATSATFATDSSYANAVRDKVYHTSSSRRTSANITFADGGLHYYLATASMTTGKPTSGDGHIIHLGWDNGYWDSQIAVPDSSAQSMQWRAQNNSSTWANAVWKTILDSSNSSVSGDNSSTISVTINGTTKSLTVASPTSVTGTSSLTLSTSDQTYLTVGSTQYKIKLPATIPWSVSTTDVAVTQTATTSSNTSWRPLLLGQKYSDAATFSISTDTSTAYATHLAKFKPSTGQLAIGGLYKMKSDATLETGTGNKVFNINGGVTDIPGDFFVNGTQTAATGSWKGNLSANLNITALYDGLTIYYRLPYAGLGNASLQLYKSDGTTAVGGNIPVYAGNTRLTTHYPVNSIIRMTYYNSQWRADPFYYSYSWRNIYVSGTSAVGTGTNTKAMNFVAGAGLDVSFQAVGTGAGQSGNANYFNITYKNTGVLSVDTSGNFLRFNHADTSTLLIAPAADKIKTADASDGAGDDMCYLTFTSCLDYPSSNYNTAAQYSNIYTCSGIVLHPANGRTSFFGIGDPNAGGAYSFHYGDSSLTNLLGSHTFTFGTGLTTATHTEYQTIFGKYNISDSSALFIIADGSSNSSRHNILTLDASGSLTLDGSVSQLTVKSVKYVPAAALSYSANSTITFGAATLYPIEFGGSAGTITLSFTWNSPQLGEEKHIIGYCNYSSGKTINIGAVNSDSSNTIKNTGSVSMPAHGYIEISILYVNTNSSGPNRYFVRAVGSEAN